MLNTHDEYISAQAVSERAISGEQCRNHKAIPCVHRQCGYLVLSIKAKALELVNIANAPL